jgi:DNA-binding transcriptional LysR family regulator
MAHSIHKKMNKFLSIPNKKLSELASVRELRAFVSICHHGSMAAAAQALALTGPAVSVLIRELEQKLDVRLFDRSTRSMRVSAAGREALVFAERILKQLGDLHTGMEDIAAGRSGALRIAATSSLAQTLVPPVLARFASVHPQVRIELNDCAPNQFQELILKDQVDLGIGVVEHDDPDLQAQPLCKDRLQVVAAAPWVLPGARQMDWQQLARLPLITLRAGYGVRASLNQAAAQAQVQLQVAYEVSLMGTALALVEQGLGVAVLPQSLLHLARADSLKLRTLVKPTITRQISLVTRRDLSPSPPLLAFTQMARQYFASLHWGPPST